MGKPMSKSVAIVGTGNAALCAALAALENGAKVTLLEKADKSLSGGNTKYTAGAMRFAYDGADDLIPLLRNPDDPRVKNADFGSYTTEKGAGGAGPSVRGNPALAGLAWCEI